jgi:urease accessory protein
LNTLSLLRGIRFIDSLFPSGGYAFSSGLEAAVQEGAVTDAASLQCYIGDLLEHAMAGREAIAAAHAHDSTVAGSVDSIVRVDRDLEAMKLDRAARTASRQMGKQVIRIAAESRPETILGDYLAAVETEETPGHLAVSLGVTLAACGWNKNDAVGAFLYHTTAGLISAGMKLLPVGQREAQGILETWLPLIDRISVRASTEQDMASFAPIQDIYAMRHSRLASRLFRS